MKPVWVLLALSVAVFTFTVAAAAASATPPFVPTPAELEPAPLSVDPFQPWFIHELEAPCAPGYMCLERWACPYGLSPARLAGVIPAAEHAAYSYNQAVLGPYLASISWQRWCDPLDPVRAPRPATPAVISFTG